MNARKRAYRFGLTTGGRYPPGMTDLTAAQRDALDSLLDATRFAAPVRDLGRRFEAAGHDLYLVGGSVRDALLGRPGNDVDCTTDARPEQVKALLKAWKPDAIWLQGIKFGTVGGRKAGVSVEVTPYRSDAYSPESRKPEVTFGDTIPEDLARRDFTINAMAVKLPGGDFTDPFGGLGDLATRTLRTPSAPSVSFDDDPLRMLRAARFAAQLDCTLDPATEAALVERVDRLEIVSRERIRDELTKL